ncbi:immunoglobulin-like domain-containing protein, partial [Cellulomonas rhizosphaerae]
KSSNLARDVWKRVTYTQTGTTGILYEDGVEVARNANVTLTPGSIGGGVTAANYIGRSVYTADAYLKGNVRDFAIYNRALTPSQVAAGAAAANQAAVDADKSALALTGVDAVTADLTLPTTGTQGSTIAWSSSDPAVVTGSGKVTRPAFGGPDATVTLTATLTKGGVSTTKAFTVTVLADIAPGAKATYDAEHLTVTNLDDVRGNLTLPATGPRGSAITWTSSSAAVITATGDATRPAYGQDAATVTLTATATNGGEQASHAYTATVPALPRTAPKTGYVFSYFTGDSLAGEKIYFAASRGNNALAWDELNGGAAALTSTLGSKGLRDPFLIRSPEGDKFFLIATDLSIGGGTSWDASQRSGSQYIEVWESEDLVHWSAQRHVRVSPSTAGNTWAPEAYYDEEIGAYVVFWASKLYAASDPDHTGSTYNRMMYATTRDFVTFTEPQVWQDPGKSVIDSTVLKDGDTYYRFTKDEAAASGCTDIIQERSTDLLATSPSSAWSLQANCIGKNAGTGGVEGPTIFKANPGDVNGSGFYLFVDEYGGRGYIPLKSPSLANPAWTLPASWDLPTHPRHGTVANVSASEWNQLTGAAPAAVTSSVSLALSESSVELGSTVHADVTVAASDGGEVAGDVTITAGDFSTTVTLVDGAAGVDLPATLAAGSYTVRAAYAGYDVVGAGSDTAELTVVAPPADTVAPAVVLSTAPAAPDGLGGWWTSAVTVTAVATDSGTPVSGVASVEASVDGGAWAPLAAGGVKVSADGTHVVRVRATDVAGNVSTPVTADVRVDRTAPTAKAAVSGRTVTLTGSDATSGLARLEYRVGSGAWTAYASPVTLPKQAASLGYRAVDKAGNASAAASVAVASSSAVSVGLPASLTTASTARVTVAVTAGTGVTPTGKVTVKVTQGSKVLTTKTATLSGGKASVTLPRLPAGKVSVVATYAGSTAVLGSSATVTRTVAKARASAKVTLNRTTARPNQKVVATVAVSGPLKATGKVTVTIRKGSHTFATKTLTLSSSGRASITLPALASGTYTVSAAYAGSATLGPATSKAVSLRVR